MLRNFFAFVGRLSPGRLLLLGLFSAVLIEAATVVLRFGLDLQATRDTGTIGAYTFGLRIHHGYIGVLIAAIACCFRRPSIRNFLLVPAIGLFLSDMFHHFLVLWPLTGSPQFHWVYPA
jgi:hypothetical protein